MRICVLSPVLARALESLGHDVASFWPEGQAEFDLAAALDAQGFEPDLIFQQESLGPRTLLQGLERFRCPKIFWSLDTHLNLYWHRYYARLFDGVLTPHLSIWHGAAPSLGLNPQAARMAMFGQARPWRPFAERSCPVAFVGRITEHRLPRRWLAEFLKQRHEAAVAMDLSHPEMMRLYEDSWLAPNESILCEVNFRVMEAASCGCLVISQDVGPDQDVLMTPGEEIETYEHVLELQALLEHYRTRPDQAETKARAGWERIQAEHLPIHRAQALLAFAERVAATALHGQDAQAAHVLTLFQMRRGGLLVMPWKQLAQRLEALPDSPEVLAALAALLAEERQKDLAQALLADILTRNRHPADLELALTGSMAGVFLDEWDLARQFWYRLRRTLAPADLPERPKNPAHLCQLWAAELQRADHPVWTGITYDPQVRLPETVLECLSLASYLDPDDRRILRRMEALLSRLKGYDYLRLGHLSTLTLFQRSDWRLGLALALVNLRAFRLDQGLEELALARDAAVSQGKTASFRRALAGMDPGGTALQALGGPWREP